MSVNADNLQYLAEGACSASVADDIFFGFEPQYRHLNDRLPQQAYHAGMGFINCACM